MAAFIVHFGLNNFQEWKIYVDYDLTIFIFSKMFYVVLKGKKNYALLLLFREMHLPWKEYISR